MRKLLLFLALSYSVANAQQQIRVGGPSNVSASHGLAVGDKSPALKFVDLLNYSKPDFSLAAHKGKVVILEFWATWCGPCLPAITHLSDLKKQFGDKLEVIAISNETPERIERFIKNKPSSLIYATDTENSLQEYFPFHSIPHSVIIDPDGKIAAITSPTEINSNVITSLLDGKKISVKQKMDGGGGFDMMKDYFPRSTSFDDYLFEIQPPVAGGFPMTKRMSGTSPWFNRRLTIMNSPVNIIYRTAFEKSVAKTVFDGVTLAEFDHRTTKNLYSIDVIVPKGKEKELYPYLREQLLTLNLEYKCKIEKRKMESVVITCTDASKLQALKNGGEVSVGAGTGQPSVMRATNYQKKNVPLSDMFLHFENFGILKQPVVDETGLSGNFDLVFNIDMEDANSFKNELAKLGLKAQKLEREVEVLVIYKD